MKIRNEILKLAVNWEKQEPGALSCPPDWFEPFSGLTWRLMSWDDGGPMVMQTVAKPGLDFGYHLHPDHDELIVVVEGEAHIEVITKQYILKPGDTLLIPKGILHRGVYPDGCKLMLIFK